MIRRNLNTSFYDFQKVKAAIEPYFICYDTNSFPTVVKNRVDKRRPVDFLFSNQRGEFVSFANKREKSISFRNSATLE